MAVFHKGFVKRIDAYKAAVAKAQAAERTLLSEFETMDSAEIQKLIHIVEEKGQPSHQKSIKIFADKFNNGQYSADDLVEFQNILTANRSHIEGKNS